MSHAVFCSVLMGIDKVFLLVVVDVISIHAPLAGCDALLRPPGNRRAKRRFQSTHPLRGATYRRAYGGWRCGISIHAPLAGCDRRFCILVVSVGYFNPRTPCGVRPPRPRAIQRPWAFQSTHPLRGATGVQVNTQTVEPKFQSTHPLRGATRGERPLLWIEKFQSTHPLRGATIFWLVKPSILVNFNPRTPCGVRRRRS